MGYNITKSFSLVGLAISACLALSQAAHGEPAIFPVPALDSVCVEDTLEVPDWNYQTTQQTHSTKVFAIVPNRFLNIAAGADNSSYPKVWLYTHGHFDAVDTPYDFAEAPDIGPVFPDHVPYPFNLIYPIPIGEPPVAVVGNPFPHQTLSPGCGTLPDISTPEAFENLNGEVKSAVYLLQEGSTALLYPVYDSKYPPFNAILDVAASKQWFEGLVYQYLQTPLPDSTKTVVKGCSQGGYVALKVAEWLPETGDAYVAQASSWHLYQGQDIATGRLLYHYAFGEYDAEGNLTAGGWDPFWSEPGATDPIQQPRASLDFDTWENYSEPFPLFFTWTYPVDYQFEVVPELSQKLGFLYGIYACYQAQTGIPFQGDPSILIGQAEFLKTCEGYGLLTVQDMKNIAGFELIRRFMDRPLHHFYLPTIQTNPLSGETVIQTPGLEGIFYFGTEAWGEAVRTFAKDFGVTGPIFSQAQVKLKHGDEEYFSSLGIDARDFQRKVNRHLSPEIHPNMAQALALDNHSGVYERPILHMWTTVDHQVPLYNAALIREAVEKAGYQDNYMLVFNDSLDHCDFTPEQHLTAFHAALDWSRTGVRPAKSAFPTSLGFVRLNPPKWPYRESDVNHKETHCQDGWDNDGDNSIDCADADCTNFENCL